MHLSERNGSSIEKKPEGSESTSNEESSLLKINCHSRENARMIFDRFQSINNRFDSIISYLEDTLPSNRSFSQTEVVWGREASTEDCFPDLISNLNREIDILEEKEKRVTDIILKRKKKR